MAGLDAFKDNQEVKVIDTSKKIRVGIIGTGGIANSHMKAYLKQPDVEVVAGADIVPDGVTLYKAVLSGGNAVAVTKYGL